MQLLGAPVWIIHRNQMDEYAEFHIDFSMNYWSVFLKICHRGMAG